MSNQEKVQVAEVFPNGGFPKYSFVDRSSRRELAELGSKLRALGIVVFVHGPSKSGKTVFCENALRGRKPFTVYGNTVKGIEDVWSNIAKKIGRGIEKDEVEQILYRDKNPIVIDNFHKIPEEGQREIIDSLRPLLDNQVSFAFISVPDQADRLMRIDADLIGRSVRRKFPPWNVEELEAIALKGFPKLNVQVPFSIRNLFARQACTSPLLMQRHCANLAEHLGITTTVNPARNIDGLAPEALRRIFLREEENIRPQFEQLRVSTHGGLRLKNGRQVNAFDAIMFALSFHQIKTPISINALSGLMAKHVEQVPPVKNLRSMAIKLAERSVERLGIHSAIGFDADYDRIYINHPDFLFYLRWRLAPMLGGTEPWVNI